MALLAKGVVQVKRVALFGGGGFVGVNLARRLAESAEFLPVVYDTTDEKLVLRFRDTVPCAFHTCDVLTDAELLDHAVSEADIVVNLVSHVLPKRFIDRPLDVIGVTLKAAMKVIDATIKHDKRLIHFSTSEVYGKTNGRDQVFFEDRSDCVLGPIENHRWIYSTSKQLLDRIIHGHGMAGDLEYTIVRPFNFVGPLMDWLGETDETPRVFASFMTALMTGQPIQLVDGGHSQRCFTYIDDGVDALMVLLRDSTGARNNIFNIGNPQNETTIAELAELMRGIYRQETGKGQVSPIRSVSAETFYGVGYEDCDRRMPDVSKLAALGWKPRTTLEQTFAQSIRYAIDNAHELGLPAHRKPSTAA